MPWRISSVILAFLCLNGLTIAYSWDKTPHEKDSETKSGDIKFDFENGSGSFSDDEDFGLSGSGSGSGMGDFNEKDTTTAKLSVPPVVSTTTVVTSTTTTTTTARKLSDCQLAREESKNTLGVFVPRCLDDGSYDALQCNGHKGTGDCWCSDLDGKLIMGTLMKAPNYPDCETGLNLSLCIFRTVKHVRTSPRLLGVYRPQCVNDLFEKVQCHGSLCFCVDEKTGIKVTGTDTHKPKMPNCEVDVDEPKIVAVDTKKEESSSENEEKNIIDLDEGEGNPVTDQDEKPDKINTVSKGNDEDDDEESKPDSDDNKTDNDSGTKIQHSSEGRVEKATSEIMTQPGILAGIIGGSVVILLCLVLLIMFVVYRMRKKDEGSYPLDEPRKTPNYSYVRAPEKEFYA
ncbi:uncharacterized protein LOC131928958 [Physella acuta]|uniref:uncharacterized protein LOC131928958 n=1 Tax=Physella acuta TaxID=109671 RepID=UPI0027DD2FFE|nr:uncharacterized protein LOC131928958 [Physella acuta]